MNIFDVLTLIGGLCLFLFGMSIMGDALERRAGGSLKNILAKRKELRTEWLIDGYSGFILLDKDDKPKVALHIENEMRWAMKKYDKLHPDQPLPHITPHVFRHTFCTNMANAGMDIKSLQYLMGHSDADITMNVYTHASYDRAEASLQKILQFQPESMERKSG